MFGAGFPGYPRSGFTLYSPCSLSSLSCPACSLFQDPSICSWAQAGLPCHPFAPTWHLITALCSTAYKWTGKTSLRMEITWRSSFSPHLLSLSPVEALLCGSAEAFSHSIFSVANGTLCLGCTALLLSPTALTAQHKVSPTLRDWHCQLAATCQMWLPES